MPLPADCHQPSVATYWAESTIEGRALPLPLGVTGVIPNYQAGSLDVSEYQQQFLDALPQIEAVVRHVARRYRLTMDECSELEGQVKLRLIEDEYRVFRKFEGRSSLRTYLVTVVSRLLLDERTRQWGKWRPSQEAQRLGPLAVTLERLIVREEMPPDAAIATIVSRDPSQSDTGLRAIVDRLPVRAVPRRVVSDSALTDVPSPAAGPEHLLLDDERRESMTVARAALQEATASLSSRERLLLTLRYEQGARVADIAKTLGVPQKPLYRQFEGLLERLREHLEARGLSADDIARLCQGAVDDDSQTPITGSTPSSGGEDEGNVRLDAVAG